MIQFNKTKKFHNIWNIVSFSHIYIRKITSLQYKNINFHNEIQTKYYDYKKLDNEIYKWWESNGYFQPSGNSNEKFIIAMPPPNITGRLHVGHAVFVTLQDILTRFHRMKGKTTLWLPGTDHAGIATQLLVEKAMAKEGLNRSTMGREEFVKRVWKWKEENGSQITHQLRRLGASADWSREKFTLDDNLSEAVTEAFVRLYEKGLVYKGDYMVNWSPSLQTAVSDLEVEYTEEEGTLYYFKYMLSEDGSGTSGQYIPVSTTRPETILGDTAVCVHPEDDRYAAFVGRRVIVPMSGGRSVPVIADDYVDREFGTGALKITPAHDPNDYAIGKRHSLPSISIMNKDATIKTEYILDSPSKYDGMDRFKCREVLWEDMKAAGLTLKTEKVAQRIPRSQRGGEIIEPMISEQWFVNMETMAKRAISAAHCKDIVFVPERFEKDWYKWLENIRDWCVSRQLWWGHRIPVYYLSNDRSKWVVARTYEEALDMAREKFGPEVEIVQDDDVLDTWFSSGLWPFSTLGWPHNTGCNSDLMKFYPTSVLETGYDILFFWVARMVMMGLEFTDRVPFHTVYLHGIVRDGEGRKMSKTTGNVVDPIDTMDMYGCDALRYSLVVGSSPGQDVLLDADRVKISRNFVNKLWNAGKYIDNSLQGLSPHEMDGLAIEATGLPMSEAELASIPLAERYIISRCHEVVHAVTVSLEKYQFAECGKIIQEFLWDEFADWYIEISKTRNHSEESRCSYLASRRALVYVWDRCLRLTHPFMPFITETLWQCIPHNGDTLMLSPWPDKCDGKLPVDELAIVLFSEIKAAVKSIRNTRSEHNVEPKKRIGARIVLKGAESHIYAEAFRAEKKSIELLAKIDSSDLEIIDSSDCADYLDRIDSKQYVRIVVSQLCEVLIPVATMVDREKEISRIQAQIEKLQGSICALQQRLSNEGFVRNAKPDVVNKFRVNLIEQEEQLSVLKSSLSDILSS